MLDVFFSLTLLASTLSRSIPYDKLDRSGICDVNLDFIKAYFSKRLQYVYYDTAKSYIRYQELDFIQGSKTGFLVSDIYSSDFARMCSDDESILYADDNVCTGLCRNNFGRAY